VLNCPPGPTNPPRRHRHLVGDSGVGHVGAHEESQRLVRLAVKASDADLLREKNIIKWLADSTKIIVKYTI
jgi:hypothetical protein